MKSGSEQLIMPALRSDFREDCPRVNLGQSCDIRNAGELRDRLLEAMRGNASIDLDARRLDSIDTGAIQVLLSASRSAAAAGGELAAICEELGALPRAMARLGLIASG